MDRSYTSHLEHDRRGLLGPNVLKALAAGLETTAADLLAAAGYLPLAGVDEAIADASYRLYLRRAVDVRSPVARRFILAVVHVALEESAGPEF